MAASSALSDLCIAASDLRQWEQFASGVLGLQVGREGQQLRSQRMDEYEQRLLIEQGTEDDLVASGSRFKTFAALENYVNERASREARTEPTGRPPSFPAAGAPIMKGSALNPTTACFRSTRSAPRDSPWHSAPTFGSSSTPSGSCAAIHGPAIGGHASPAY